jgi:hypothetical protein
MGVHYAIDVWPCLENLRVDKNFRVAFVLALDLFAVEITDDDMIRPDLLKAEAVRLHEDLVLPRDAHRNVAENIIPVALGRKDIARVC